MLKYFNTKCIQYDFNRLYMVATRHDNTYSTNKGKMS